MLKNLHKRKEAILIISASLILGTCIFNNCMPDVTSKPKTHYYDSTLTRSEQIKKCGTCHKDVYESWKIGPHANAYKTLGIHLGLTDTSKNFPKEYHGYVSAMMGKVCTSCHTGQNIFETNFKGIHHNENPQLVKKNDFPMAFKQALSRDVGNKFELMTGVDCITCHSQNGKIITKFSSNVAYTLGLIRSRFFSDNMSCYSCHHHQVETMKQLVNEKKIASEISCVNCHQEYTNKGKGTHYFYWRNDSARKVRPKHLNIFDCVKLTVENKKMLRFSWTNTIMPHGFSECGDAKCIIIIVYKDGKSKRVIEQVINRKDFFDERKEFPPHFHTGKNGNHFEYKNPILKEVKLQNELQIDYFIVLGLVKPQYWSKDKEFKEVYKIRVPFEELIH